MHFSIKGLAAAAIVTLSATVADAAVWKFEAVSASAGSLGWLSLDGSVLDGTSSQEVYGGDLLDLAFTDPATLQSYDASDIDPTGRTYFDSSGALPTVVGGGGDTAGDFGDGVWIAGSAFVAVGPTHYYDVSWITTDVSAVPLPAGGVLLITALGGIAALRRKKKAA